MSTHQTLLIELGTEELPPAAIASMTEQLATAVTDCLDAHEARIPDAKPSAALWGPRRMAVMVPGVLEQLPDQAIQRQGPFVDKAFDAEGNALPAALGFARSCDVEVDELEREATDKGERLLFRQLQPGQRCVDMLADKLADLVEGIAIPKAMRWGEGEFSFVRPLHWVVALLGPEIIPATVKGIKAGRETAGHRFHSQGVVTLDSADAYTSALETAFVFAQPDQRRNAIAQQLVSKADELGLKTRIDEALLDEVNALVEWPRVIDGGFDAALLRVPHEALIACMQVHQKFFPLFDSEGGLANRFLAVANIESKQPQAMQRGYEKVILPRLADAAFFFDEDRRKGFAAQKDKLSQVVFQERLGSVADKSARVARLATGLAAQVGADPEQVQQASEYCKADLMSLMVGEFPELQGIMGNYYARLDGFPVAVGTAIEEHYLPRHASDQVPTTPAGQCLALADRIDTLVGIFAVGMVPSGNKDPYALRRAALGVIRICLEHEIDLDLSACLESALKGLPEGLKVESDIISKLIEFTVERARNYCDEQSIAPKMVFSSAAAGNWSGLFDLFQRARALKGFYQREESTSLAAADKRIRNILRKNADQVPEPANVDQALLSETAEKDLFDVWSKTDDEVLEKARSAEHEQALMSLAKLAEPLEAFFDQVMVMAADPAIRANRLALLKRLGIMMSSVGDLSQLSGSQ